MSDINIDMVWYGSLVIAVLVSIFVGFPLLRAESARQAYNKTNNTNKSLGEWMADNKGETVLYFLLVPGIFLLFIGFVNILSYMDGKK